MNANNKLSLAAIKVKETKGNKKQLPKLKTILANPNKVKCPILNDEELDELKTLLQNAVEESKLEPKCYASNKGINLGLESCLRNINNQKSSCVFVSLSIKPSHIVSLIARNAEVKDETQPVYAQPYLEDFLKEIFGIKALCMVLPKNLNGISEAISQWVEKRKKPKKVEKKEQIKTRLKTKKNQQHAKNIKKVEISKKIPDEELPSDTKSWSGDFISFGTNDNVQSDKLKLDEKDALDALTEIMEKIPIKTKDLEKVEPMEIDNFKPHQVVKKEEEVVELDDSDDFLGDYKSLRVHKIKGNPNKKPKKKRKKNKNKSKGNTK